jgi:hypothetical protein
MSLQQLIGLPPPQQYTSDDPITQGFYDSEFFKPNAPTTMDVVNYTYQGNPMTGSSSNISQFQQYLDSIGKGDLIQRNDQIFSQETGPLQPSIPPQMTPPPGGIQPIMPNYSGQFEKFGNQLTGFGEQLTGYQDALGSFNEQVGGFGKQFETINNRLDSVDKGLGSLGNQIASLENMQKAQPQQVMQPQQPMYSPFGFGLGALFGRRFF